MSKYYNLSPNGVLIPAPKKVLSDGKYVDATEELYRKYRYFTVVEDEKPDVGLGYKLRARYEWRDKFGKATRIRGIAEKIALAWEVVPPRRWTPLAIKRAAEERGWWMQLREALVAADLLEEFWGCHYVAEDDPKYPTIKAGMDALFGEADVDKFLDSVSQEVR